MPAEVPQKYKEAMAEVRQVLRNASLDTMPDIVERIAQATRWAPHPMAEPATATTRSVWESPSIATDATPKVWLWLLVGGMMGLLILLGGLVVLTFLR